jgi:hypothetical protein
LYSFSLFFWQTFTLSFPGLNTDNASSTAHICIMEI